MKSEADQKQDMSGGWTDGIGCANVLSVLGTLFALALLVLILVRLF